MSGRKIGTIVAGLAVGLVALWLWLRPAADEGHVSNGGPAARSTPKAGARFLPWLLGGGAAKEPGALLPYKGPTIPVYVKVVDLAGEPVAGADVDAKADREEYETAGLTDEEYEAWSTARDAAAEKGSEDDDWDEDSDWATVPLTPVESGRTDRRGEYVVRLRPDVAVVFHARDGRGREGISSTIYVYDPALEENTDFDESPRARDASGAPPRLEVTIEIAELSTLSGIVVDDRGRPIEGAEITLTAWSSMEVGDESLVVPGDARGERGGVMTGADGRFRVTLRGSGAFDLEAYAKGFQYALEQAVQILPGRETIVNLTLLPAASLAGQVVGPDGAGIGNARVLVQGEPAPGTFVSQEVTTDEAGAFEVEELAPGRYVVAASAEGFRPGEMWNIATGGEPVTVRLTRGGSIRGTVTARVDALPPILRTPDHGDHAPDVEGDSDWGKGTEIGAGSEDAAAYYGDVYIAHSGRGPDELVPIASGVPRDRERESPSGALDARGRYFAQARLDEQGRGTFDVEGLPGGVYDLTVMFGTAIARLEGVRVPESGRTDVRVAIPDGSGGSIAGTIRRTDGLRAAHGTVFLYGGSLPSGLSATVSPDGRFDFASVPPGEYRVHAMLGGPGGDDVASPKSVSAPAGDEAAYAPVRVVVVPPSGGTISIELLAYPANEPMPPSIDDAILDDSGITGTEDDTGLPIAYDDADDGAVDPDDVPLPEDLWTPEVWIEEIDGNLVVTSAPPGPEGARLFGGDRVTSIDGIAVSTQESWQALELLYGPQGSLCRITADRPATQATVTVSLRRTRKVGDDGEDF